MTPNDPQSETEYIVVGSGAGGGTVAARLAEAGHTVLLLEAGGNSLELQGGDAISTENRLPDDYDVPVFHALSTENVAMKWDYFVRHYADEALQKRDDKYVPEKRGVLYPRAGTLGGCTAHNAQITVYPHNADWNAIAALTGDPSWGAENMRAYFERIENCRYRPLLRALGMEGINPSRHGWNGWLGTENAVPESALDDKKLVHVIIESAFKAFLEEGRPLQQVREIFSTDLDPNDWRFVTQSAEGIHYPPLATWNHQRNGTRERVLDVAKRYPDRLRIETNALATRVLFGEENRAVGVEYLKGAWLYGASGMASSGNGERREARASREVILSGGAFNTPQLLMLSGIGPQDQLKQFGIPARLNLPGVGKNLQDRYEVGVVNRMNFACWEVLKDAKFAKGDPQYDDWSSGRRGVYTTNGAILAIIKRAAANRPLPDLFCFALLGFFKGYYPGYSKLFPEKLNYLTWAILKAHTNNTAGEVTLRSADARQTPDVNFRYFSEGNDVTGEDLDSVVDGIKFVRSMTRALKEQGIIAEEELPGDKMQSDADLKNFVRDNAWGHHASCTCPIGLKPEDGAVLRTDFSVYGTKGLRVVDASVFPRIPGFFIVSAVYMVGEKAADVILAAADA